MKSIILYFSIIIASVGYSQDFFDTDQIQTIELSFAQANWDDILDTYYISGSDFRLIGAVSLNGEQFDSVGVRYKGNSSFNASQVKNPLNIKLDFVKGKQEINGRNVLKLSNVFRDPSFVREVISYEIARKYLPSSASNYAKVFVNGTYIGLYVNDESTNLSFMGRHYFKPNYPYFEGEFTMGATPTGCTSGPPNVLGYLGTTQACYEQFYALQSNNPNDWNELMLALDTFNNFPTQMDNAIYVDRLLWMLAFDNVMVNLDAPINAPHNFSLYKDKTERFNPILWDLNESFGSFNSVGVPGSTPLTVTELQQLDPWYNSSNPNYSILNKPFQDDRNKKMYIAKMKTIFNENINNDLYSQRAIELQTLISSAVTTDINKFYEDEEFTQNLNSSVQGRVGLTELMEGRKTFLNNHADFLKVAPTVINITNSPQEVHSNTSVTISAEITDANYAYVGYRFSPKEKFIQVQMTASGNNYTASINVEHADIQYYIWAENDDAGIFSPERAEYEFYRIGVTADVVINELQSSNQTTQFDEAVEYDDWVELHNNTSSAINLTGYYLSDNKDTLTKWQIPAQSIAANDYVIFWTDKDFIQGANHTNFQLTKNGESLYLVNPTGNIIDQVTYTHMPTDLSYSRFPNGRGPFIIKEPTFKANNGEDSTTIAIETMEEENNSFYIYPNPSNSYVYLNSNIEVSKKLKIEFYDILGKKVISQPFKANEKINVSKLNTGIYFVEIDSKTLRFVKK